MTTPDEPPAPLDDPPAAEAARPEPPVTRPSRWERALARRVPDTALAAWADPDFAPAREARRLRQRLGARPR